VELLHQLEAAGVVGGPIGRIEGPARGGDRRVDILGGRIRGLADRLSRPGADVVIGLVAGARRSLPSI